MAINRNNFLVGRRSRAESNPAHWVRHTLLHMVGVGHFGHKFQEMGVANQRLLASENYDPWAIRWRCLHNPTFSRFDTIPACDRHTDIQVHDDG